MFRLADFCLNFKVKIGLGLKITYICSLKYHGKIWEFEMYLPTNPKY